MISAKFDAKSFIKDMNNIIGYSTGYIDGIELGKRQMLYNLGKEIIEVLKEYVDANARLDPSSLHHVYEWYQTGSPNARLFDIDYTVSNLGLSFKSTFRQSTSVQRGSTVPFYNKATLMENGISVTITPRKSSVLAFEDEGEQVFTRKPVTVNEPGGSNVQGSYEKIFDEFFDKYFRQSLLMASGLSKYLGTQSLYKKDLPAGKKGGRSQGLKTGYRWITNVRIGA